MGGAWRPLSGQSPAAVAQGITGSQLLGYTYQASTLDPNASAVDSRCPGKLTPSRPVPSHPAPPSSSDTSCPHSTSVIYFFTSWWPLHCIMPPNRDLGAASMPYIAVDILWKTQRPLSVPVTHSQRNKNHQNIWFTGCETKILLMWGASLVVTAEWKRKK